jgi:hypothetical protein
MRNARQAPKSLSGMQGSRMILDIITTVWAVGEVNRALPAIRLIFVEGYLVGDKLLLIRYLTTNHRELYHPGTAEGAWRVW